MDDEQRTRDELIAELKTLRARLAGMAPSCPVPAPSAAIHDFQSLFDAFDTPVSLLDTHFRFQACNNAYEDYLGIPVHEIIGQTPALIVGEDSFEQSIKPRLRQCMAGNAVSFPMWVDYRRKGPRYMEILYVPRRGESGAVEGILHISRDNTERFRLEQEAAAIVETAFSGLLVVDARGKVIGTNGPATEMLGYSREEMLGLRLGDIGAGMDGDDALRMIRELSRLGRDRFETRLRRKDGALLDVEVNATYLAHEGGKVYAFLRDLSPFRTIEQELRDSEARFKALHDASFGGIAIHDKGLILDCNQGLSELSGFSREELIGMDGLLLIAEESRPLVMANILAGYEQPYEAFGIRKNGDTYPLRLQARNIPYKGKPVRAVEFRDITETKKAQQALEDSHARLKAVVENMPVLLDAFDDNGRLVFWNRECERVTGYSFAEVAESPDPLAILYPDPGYRSYIMQRVDDVGGKFLGFDFDITCKDGSVRTIAWSNISSRAPIPGWDTWAIGVDVTEHRRDRHALLESERKYKSVVENMQDVYYRTDTNGILTMVSPSSARLFRLESVDEAIGMHASSFYKHPEERQKALEELRRTGVLKDFEATLVTKDGTELFVSTNSTYWYDEAGNVLGVEGVLRDITQRKETEKRIAKSEAKFRALFDHAGEGIFIADRDSNITDANHAAAMMLGWDDPAKLIGLNAADIIHPDDLRARSSRVSLEEARRDKVLRIERRFRRRDGSYLPVQVTIKYIGDTGLHHVLFSDMSERKRFEEALRTRIIALTQPAADSSAITFETLFDLEEIQRIQDEFAMATGVASMITRPDGTPLTRPSNFRRFCRDIVRESPLGAGNCICSDAVVGEGFDLGPRIQQCLSAGLWDAGAGINVGGRHVANWIIGQVRDGAQTEDSVRAYARRIGVDEEGAVRAFREVPVMSLERFTSIARALHTLVRHISALAFQNLQQARFIEAKNKAEGSNRLLAELLNSSDSIAVYKDTLLRYKMANNEFLRLTGYESHADIVGRTDEELLAHIATADHIARYIETDRRALALPRGETLTVEERYPCAGGLDRVFQTKKFPIFEGDAPEPVGVASLSSEITEVKRIQERLAHEKTNAEAANRAKTEFLANMSHEIRTPLNGISGMMQLLQTTAMDQEQQEYVDMATKSCSRLTTLLTDILDISRIEAGRLEFRREEFRIRDLAQSVSELFGVTHVEKGVPFLCRIDPAVPEVLVGDEARIRQILFNLVGNAFKFTDKGAITLEIEPVFSPSPDETRILFSVHDTGIGIPQDRLKGLFSPFAQVETALNRKHQGAGLGLAIVKRLAGLMGGHIFMDTVPGEGTSAHVVLPFAHPAGMTAPGHVQAGRTMTGLSGMNILVVEDDRSNQYYMQKLLEKAGARSSTAENGLEAIELWQSGDYDCILMDIQMPAMDGVEATRRIRNSNAGSKADIPIVALTSYAMAGDREKFLAAGMDAYLSKPVQTEELEQTLTGVCLQRNTERKPPPASCF